MAFYLRQRQGQQFVLIDVTPTGRTGSYGSVEEVSVKLFWSFIGRKCGVVMSCSCLSPQVTYKHLTCAGKNLHEVFIEAGNDGGDEVVHKYLQECQLMSILRHPNIIQFFDLCFLPGTQLPLLVMERLMTSLDDLLEHRTNQLSHKCSVLEDVASALLYLHKMQPVIRRDLTAYNVLLTSSLVTKISEMGNSHIIDMKGGQIARTLSKLPDTFSLDMYMLPEALDDRHRYGPSLDVFSYGHLELVEAHQCVLYPNLVQLCLQNIPNQRPSIDELLATPQRMMVELERDYDMVRVRPAKAVKNEQRITQQVSSALL